MAFLLLFALLKPMVGDVPLPDLAQAQWPSVWVAASNRSTLPHQMDEVHLRAMSSRDCFSRGTREHLCRLFDKAQFDSRRDVRQQHAPAQPLGV
jgi:hypothetical protein